jgi:hypothetical protein
MSRILTITMSALMLAGCAVTYDKSAMPKAAASLQQEAGGCTARWAAKEFKTYSEWQACELTAERGFARTINLTKMDAFDVYAADMQALAADRDTHRVTDRQARSRAKDIQWKFFADCGCKPGRRIATNSAQFGGTSFGMPSGDVPMRVDRADSQPGWAGPQP